MAEINDGDPVYPFHEGSVLIMNKEGSWIEQPPMKDDPYPKEKTQAEQSKASLEEFTANRPLKKTYTQHEPDFTQIPDAFLKRIAQEQPERYMRYVTKAMLIEFT